MKPIDIILIIVIALILVLAILYIINAKKKGHKCIGCPNSQTCSQVECHQMHKKSDYCSCDRNRL